MKKIATLLISLVIILLSCLTVLADTPTAISTEAELKSISALGNYYLAKDITLTGNFAPLPTFSGTLDGRGKTISGLKISTTAGSAKKVYCGLFQKLDGGTIKNLTLKDVDIEVSGGSTVYAGAIVGKIDSGSIFNCRVGGKITAHEGNASIYIGGIAGENLAEIYLCENYALISAEGLHVIAGGVVGEHKRPDFEIKQCANYGTVSASGRADINYAGGIVGKTENSVSNCANFGSVSLESDGKGYVGGITAEITQGKISTCFSGGALSCKADTDPYTDPIAPLHKNSFSNNYYRDNVIKNLIPNEIKTGSALDSKTALSAAAFSGFDFNSCWEMKNSALTLRGITCPKPVTEQNDNNNNNDNNSSAITSSESQTSSNQTSGQPTTSETTSSDITESSPTESNSTTSASTSSLTDDKAPQYNFNFVVDNVPPIWVFVIIAVVLLAGVGAFLYFYKNRKK